MKNCPTPCEHGGRAVIIGISILSQSCLTEAQTLIRARLLRGAGHGADYQISLFCKAFAALSPMIEYRQAKPNNQ